MTLGAVTLGAVTAACPGHTGGCGCTRTHTRALARLDHHIGYMPMSYHFLLCNYTEESSIGIELNKSRKRCRATFHWGVGDAPSPTLRD